MFFERLQIVCPAGSPPGEADFSLPVTYQLNIMHGEVLAKTRLNFWLYDCRYHFAAKILESGTDFLTFASMPRRSNPNRAMGYARPFKTEKSEAVRQIQKKKAKVV